MLLPPPPQLVDLNQAAAARAGPEVPSPIVGDAAPAPAPLPVPAVAAVADSRKRKSKPPPIKLELALGDLLVGTPQTRPKNGSSPSPDDYEIGLICQHLPGDQLPFKVQWAYYEYCDEEDAFTFTIKRAVIGQTTRPFSVRERVTKIGHVAELYGRETPSLENVDLSQLPVVCEPQGIAFTEEDVKKLIGECRKQLKHLHRAWKH